MQKLLLYFSIPFYAIEQKKSLKEEHQMEVKQCDRMDRLFVQYLYNWPNLASFSFIFVLFSFHLQTPFQFQQYKLKKA